MNLLRWAVLGCLALGLDGCSAGNKDKTKTSRAAQTSPTYQWQRPAEDLPLPQRSPKNAGRLDPF